MYVVMQDCLVTDVSNAKMMFQETGELTIVVNKPIPKTAVPMIGTNQKVFADALHPYQNNPIHIKGEMYIMDYFMWIDWDVPRRIEAKLAVGPLDIDSIVLLLSSSLFIHHCFGVFV